MDRQSKLEDEKVRKLRRYSDLFEPLMERPEILKNGKTTRHSISTVETNLIKKDEFDKTVTDFCEPNLNKPIKRRNTFFGKEVTAIEDQVLPKILNCELRNKMVAREIKLHPRNKKSVTNDISSKKLNETKHVKKTKRKRETRSNQNIENISFKENISKKNVSLPNNKCDEKDTITVKIEEETSKKRVKKRSKKSKKIVDKTEIRKKLEVRKTQPERREPIDSEILKIYMDKTVKKFNNLETIFETPIGSYVMGKRKLKRYLNFEDTNSSIKKAQRKSRVKKLNLAFTMSSIDLESLMLKNVDDLVIK